MKRLVLVLALALVLVGSASAEPLANYEHTFEFGSTDDYNLKDVFLTYYPELKELVSGLGTVSTTSSSGDYLFYTYLREISSSQTNLLNYYSGGSSVFYNPLNDYYEKAYTSSSGRITTDFYNAKVDYIQNQQSGLYRAVYDSGNLVPLTDSSIATEYLGNYGVSGTYGCIFGVEYTPSSWLLDTYTAVEAQNYVFSLFEPIAIQISQDTGSLVCLEVFQWYEVQISLVGYNKNLEPFAVSMISEVQEPWFDLFGMRGLTASFTPSNSDEDYFILFAGSDSWAGQNPDKWVWTRVHGSTDKYKIIFSGNEYTWFVRYNDEIQQYSFTYTGEEGVVPPVIVPDPEPEPPVTPPIIDTPGEADPDYPTMPDIDSPDLTVDFTSGFDEYENMTIYQNVRNMIDGFTSSIAPNVETTQLYQSLQQVIAYLQLTMEQLKEKYAVPIYNILASVSSFVPPVCWLAVDIAVIFGMFRFVVHIVTGPISSAIRERF